MFTPGYLNTRSAQMQILSDMQPDDIIQNAYTDLETTGFKILKKEGRELLHKTGANFTKNASTGGTRRKATAAVGRNQNRLGKRNFKSIEIDI